MFRTSFLFFIFFIIACTVSLAYAQEIAADKPDPKPVEISANGSLEWDKNKKTYTASEGVVVKQDNIKIECDMLVASYKDSKSLTDISQLEAVGNVAISSPPYVAKGDEAVYNVITGIATLTGDKIEVTTDKDVLTADEKIEFIQSENRFEAHGAPTIKHGSDTIRAATMVAYFKKDDKGKITSDRMEAAGGVTIETAKETVTGQKLVYDSESRRAILSGNVVVKKGNDTLQGSKAIVDMNTGISQLLGNKTAKEEKGRVTGTFFPKQGK